MRIGTIEEAWTKDQTIVVTFNQMEMSVLTPQELKILVTQRVTSMIAERILKAVEPTIEAALKGISP